MAEIIVNSEFLEWKFTDLSFDYEIAMKHNVQLDVFKKRCITPLATQ